MTGNANSDAPVGAYSTKDPAKCGVIAGSIDSEE
jgi:hypothetical protein